MKKYKSMIIIVVLAALALVYYFYLSNRPTADTVDKVKKTTKIEDVLAKDISTVTNTPKSAVKFYSEVLECLYNEAPKDEQITALGIKAREVMDEELINSNPKEGYLIDLSADVSEYSKANRIILSYVVESSDEVEYYTENDKEYAIVNASYTLRETENFSKTNEEYILRKDEEGYWKILGWRIAEQVVTEDQDNNE